MKGLQFYCCTAILLSGLLMQPVPAGAEEPVAASVAATTDVEATMKQMGLNYKQAMQATDVATMQAKVQSLLELTASVQAYQFTPEKQAVFQQGLDKVAAQLVAVQGALAGQNLGQAKQLLAEVDALKKQYHKERSPSFWQLIFGG
jgi:soluble cytochrome b562